jgi:ABC-type dipeptide/oligopeptide/nickel transport system permease subunit
VAIAALVALLLVLSAASAPLLAPFDPTDIRTFNLADSEIPPLFAADGDPRFLLGTDNQGRDMLSAILYGARVSGLPSARILLRHILPNVAGPVLVIATIHLAGAVLTEATLSFLGVGMPPTYPSLGTLIRIGNEFVFSGIWWIATLPALTLVILVLAVNVVGDWLRDRFNPKLRGRR